MRRAAPLSLALAALVVGLSACGSGGPAPTSTNTKGSGSSSPTVSAAIGTSPNASEANPAGDIPDNQTFVKYTSRDGAYALEVPEGWARTDTASVTLFSDHFNSIQIVSRRSPGPPTVANVRAVAVPRLRRSVAGFSNGTVASVIRAAGNCVLVSYRAESAADPVTGKRIGLDVERYAFWHKDVEVTLTLSAPAGSDNVDPWKKVTNSLAWST
jgi:hypothetical protein